MNAATGQTVKRARTGSKEALNRRGDFNSFPKSTPKWEFVSGSFSPVSQTNKETVDAHIVDRIIDDFVATDRLRGDIGNGVILSGSNSEPTASTVFSGEMSVYDEIADLSLRLRTQPWFRPCSRVELGDGGSPARPRDLGFRLTGSSPLNYICLPSKSQSCRHSLGFS